MLAPLLVNGFGPPDDDWATWDWDGREDAALTARGALIMLAVVSAVAGARWLLGHHTGWELLPAAQLGAALVLGTSGSPALSVAQLVAAGAWQWLLGSALRGRLPDDAGAIAPTTSGTHRQGG